MPMSRLMAFLQIGGHCEIAVCRMPEQDLLCPEMSVLSKIIEYVEETKATKLVNVVQRLWRL